MGVHHFAALPVAAYGAVLAFLSRWVALALYITVAIIWLVPDTRIERILIEASPTEQ